MTKVTVRLLPQPDLSSGNQTVEIATEDGRLTLTLTMAADMFGADTTSILGQCVQRLLVAEAPAPGCTGMHCRCMNLDRQCPNLHHGDHDCPHDKENRPRAGGAGPVA